MIGHLNDFSSFGRFPKKSTKYVESNLVVSYSRVSTKEQHDKNLSLETQQKAFEDHAGRTGKVILASFGGTYESAKTDGRKEFLRMLTFIKDSHRKVSQIWVYMTDRFSRSGAGAIKLAEDLREKYGVTIYAICQPTDTRDETGIFNQNLQFLFSHYDNRLRRKRTIDGMRAKFEKGYWIVKPPQGYDIVSINGEKKIVINEEGNKIRTAFLWKAEGMKNEEIISRLRAMGLAMYKQQLTKIFKRPFYCGIIAHGMLDGKVVQGKHEAIISQEVFLKVNNIHQKSPSYGVPHEKENPMLPLKVFVKCGECGEPFTGYQVRAKGLFYYKCRTTGCKCNVSANKLNHLFLFELQKIALRPELLSSICYRLESFYFEMTKDKFDQQGTLKKQLAEIGKKIDALQESYYIMRQMDKATFDKFNTRYQAERMNIGEKLAGSSQTISSLTAYLQEAMTIATKVGSVWTFSDVRSKENLQKLIFPKGIFYDRKNVTFRTEEVNYIFTLPI
jgi:site-specific DNA recombinase